MQRWGKPYQVRVDLEPLGHKCSCPSRKLPCKHTLGLLFVLANQPDKLREAKPPAWVADWITDRRQRAEKKQARTQASQDQAADGTSVSDPAAQARRAAKRTAAVEAGVDELALWLSDLVRQGLAAAPSLVRPDALRLTPAPTPSAFPTLAEHGYDGRLHTDHIIRTGKPPQPLEFTRKSGTELSSW